MSFWQMMKIWPKVTFLIILNEVSKRGAQFSGKKAAVISSFQLCERYAAYGDRCMLFFSSTFFACLLEFEYATWLSLQRSCKPTGPTLWAGIKMPLCKRERSSALLQFVSWQKRIRPLYRSFSSVRDRRRHSRRRLDRPLSASRFQACGHSNSQSLFLVSFISFRLCTQLDIIC